jgi:hypothetical protein
MWEMAWFSRQFLATQGAKIENIYDLLPFPDPYAIDIIENADVATENDIEYVKRMMAESAQKTI